MTFTPERWHFYRATVRMRRGGKWVVKPEAESLDGRRILVMTLWEIEPDESSLYPGEWAMEVNDPEDKSVFWVATGDLFDIEPVPFEEGLAERRATHAQWLCTARTR